MYQLIVFSLALSLSLSLSLVKGPALSTLTGDGGGGGGGGDGDGGDRRRPYILFMNRTRNTTAIRRDTREIGYST